MRHPSAQLCGAGPGSTAAAAARLHGEHGCARRFGHISKAARGEGAAEDAGRGEARPQSAPAHQLGQPAVEEQDPEEVSRAQAAEEEDREEDGGYRNACHAKGPEKRRGSRGAVKDAQRQQADSNDSAKRTNAQSRCDDLKPARSTVATCAPTSSAAATNVSVEAESQTNSMWSHVEIFIASRQGGAGMSPAAHAEREAEKSVMRRWALWRRRGERESGAGRRRRARARRDV
eukprot:scaffold79311_cov28-Tisochrysis_lutea.AAC.1